MTVCGEAWLMRVTMAVMSSALRNAPVGLFGLQTNTSPAPVAAAAILSRSSRPWSSTGTSWSGTFIDFATRPGDSNVGSADTRPFVGPVNARTAVSRSSPEPAPSRTFSAFRPFLVAISVRKSIIAGLAFIG